MRLLYLINLVKYFSLVIKDESNYQITFIFFFCTSTKEGI